MHFMHQFQDTSFSEIWQALAHRLGALMQRTKLCERALDDLEVASYMLDALPLASEPYGVATNRLRSVQRYLKSSEPGAARYELRMLIGQLKNSLEQEAAVEPQRHPRNGNGK